MLCPGFSNQISSIVLFSLLFLKYRHARCPPSTTTLRAFVILQDLEICRAGNSQVRPQRMISNDIKPKHQISDSAPKNQLSQKAQTEL